MQGNPQEPVLSFSAQTLQVQKEWNDRLKTLRENFTPPQEKKILPQGKLPFTAEPEIFKMLLPDRHSGNWSPLDYERTFKSK